MAWILNTTTNDIYTDNTTQNNVHTCFEEPFPAILWYVSTNPNDVRRLNTLEVHYPCFEEPFPLPLWFVTTDPDDVRNATTREPHFCFDHPFPYILWFVPESEDDVTHDAFFTCEGIGAFRDCANLSYIYIPPTVKEIGSEAFELTRLSEVTIASDCDYKDDSFPPNCAIYTYDT